jgi:peptidoglycan/LPS O-acetylase OafA/YrhL
LSKLAYRPDIDGLRAVAVLSVLLHHLNPALLPGGFIGVDIFFVISGYLITSQIYKEACDGNFSIKKFYKRRINRIVPALLTVSVATLLVGVFLLSPEDLMRMTNSAVLAMVGLSNVFFWNTYGNYFAGNTFEAPLLHTWSLGVEEQFYLIWPLLILLLLKLKIRFRLAIFALVTVGAIAVSEIGTNSVASASYYLLPTRFFELMFGGLLALAGNRLSSVRYSSLCAASGYALIAASLFWLDKDSSFPGVNALWPCLGAVLLILAGSGSSLLLMPLTARPMVFIGLISYSLYLWHWPIISYLNYLDIEIDFTVGAAVVLSAILLAWLSWKFIERPLRRSGAALSIPRVFLGRFATPVLALVMVGCAVDISSGVPQRFHPRVAELERMSDTHPEKLRRGCHVPPAKYATPPNDECRLGGPKTRPDGILIGDSFANHFTGMVDVMANAEKTSFMDYTMDGCPPIRDYDTGKKGMYAERCLKRNAKAYDLIAANHYQRVILAAQWPRNAEAGRKLAASIDAVLKSGAKLTLIVNNERIRGAASCSIRRLMFDSSANCDGERQGPPDYFEQIRALYPQVHIVDPNLAICRSDKCNPVLNDKLLYRDDVHLNDVGSREIGYQLLAVGMSL